MLPFILFSTLLPPTFAESEQQWFCNSSDATVSYSYCGKWGAASYCSASCFQRKFSQNPKREGRGEGLCGSSCGGCWGLGWGWGWGWDGDGASDHFRVWVSARSVRFLALVFLSLQSSQFQCNCFFQSPRPEKPVPPKEAASWWGFPLQSVVLEGSSRSISVLGFRFSLSPTVWSSAILRRSLPHFVFFSCKMKVILEFTLWDLLELRILPESLRKSKIDFGFMRLLLLLLLFYNSFWDRASLCSRGGWPGAGLA